MRAPSISFLERTLQPTDEAVAVDQAGHAVVAVALGCTLRLVTLEPDVVNPGRVDFDPPQEIEVTRYRHVGRGPSERVRETTEEEQQADALRQWFHLQAVVWAAGGCALARRAQMRPRSVGDPPAMTGLVDLDVASIAMCAKAAGLGLVGSRADAFERKATARAERLLRVPHVWAAVGVLTSRLLMARTLSGAQATAIVQPMLTGCLS